VVGFLAYGVGMSFSRRQFIQASGLALCASALPFSARAAGPGNPLPVPPLIESRRGQPLFLTLQRSHWSFDGNSKVPVWGVNGLYLGPTVRVWAGDDVKLIYSNRLNEPVAMTVSGLQVPGALMGGAARMMSPGVDWAPVVPIRQPAATCWYHANTPNRMAPHVYNGLAGMWLIEDEVSKSLPVPNHYGVDDFPLIIQDKRLDNFGAPEYDPPENGGFIGDTLLVNGIQNAYVEVSRGWVRLRLLNASNARRYQLRMSDGRPFNVIASDQGFLPAPVAVEQLSLAPGERREILVDMSQGDEVSITAGEAAGVMDRLRGFFEPSSILTSTQILNLRPTGLLPLVTDNLPMRLLADQMIEGAVSRTREFRLGDSVPGINGALWDMNRTDVQAQQGSFERWIVHADTPQAFHIQGVMFLIKNVNGAQPMAEDRGWKDTVWVDGSVELFVSFPQSTSEHFPFTYYSQTLEMADRGTAGQLAVNPTL
jgi:suppressor of ftsI